MSKILFIGLDAADWELISSKIQAGALPNFSHLMAHGASGPLRSLYPLFSPALWTSIATGKRPYEHGIFGFTLPDETAYGLRPYNRYQRCSPAFWNMFSYHQKKCHIINWWTTAPAEKIHGVIVDETFRLARRSFQEPWDIPPGSVFPKSIATTIAQERVHPQQVSEALLRTLLPKLYEIDPSADFRVAALAKILAEDLTTLQITLRLMSEESWELSAPYFIGLDSLSHLAMSYRQPALHTESERDNELYGEVVDRAYELYDNWIGQLIRAAGEETNIIIASDHGFYHDHRKPTFLGIQETAPAIHHSPLGMLVMKGPKFHQGITIKHATILDLCPTLLALADLPVGEDMPGKILSDAFSYRPTLKKISSWNQYWSFSSSPALPSLEERKAALEQLIALGYLHKIPSDREAMFREAQCNELFHHALAFFDDDRFEEAIPLLQQAHDLAQKGPHPSSRTDIIVTLAISFWRLGEERKAAFYFYQFGRFRRRDALEAKRELEEKISSPLTSHLSFAQLWEVRLLLTRAQFHEEGIHFMRRLARFLHHRREEDLHALLSYARAHPQDYFAQLHAGSLALEDQEEEGIDLLTRVADERPEESAPLAILANHFCQRKIFAAAEQSAREALLRNPLDRLAWLALATTLLHQEHYAEAWQAAQEAKKSVIQEKQANQLLALIECRGEKNFTYFNQALEYRPRELEESKILFQGNDSLTTRSFQKNRSHREKVLLPIDHFADSITEYPILVTGLPRSGTSLIMQMLAAGGLSINTDHARQADKHNPRGYFEHEKIKTIKTIKDTCPAGVVTKVVLPLIFNLLEHERCSLIWIRRSLEEVIESQHRMAGLNISHRELENIYRYYEAKMEISLQQNGWPSLQLEYSSIIANPHQTARAVCNFLKHDLDQEAMANVVTPSLYRVRKKKQQHSSRRKK